MDPRQRRLERRSRRRERWGRETQPTTSTSAPATGASPAATSGGVLGRRRGDEGGLIKRTLGEKVLYLMVVNLPSEEELQAAKEAVERLKKEEPAWWEKILGGGK